MSIIVHVVSSDSSLMSEDSIRELMLDVFGVEPLVEEVTPQIQYTIEQMDLPKAIVPGKVTVDSEDVDFREWVWEHADNLPMKEASAIINQNAWKIKSLTLVPAFGEDPEMEWAGFMSLLDSDESFYEFWTEADDYRTIMKRFAILLLAADFGE